MSDTPETDEAERIGHVKNQSDHDSSWPWDAIKRGYDHARQLERERDEARRMWSIHQDKLAGMYEAVRNLRDVKGRHHPQQALEALISLLPESKP